MNITAPEGNSAVPDENSHASDAAMNFIGLSRLNKKPSLSRRCVKKTLRFSKFLLPVNDGIRAGNWLSNFSLHIPYQIANNTND